MDQLKSAWKCGDEKDNTKLFVNTCIDEYSLYTVGGMQMILTASIASACGLDVQKANKVALLMTIHVPETERKKGLASAVVDLLEKRANAELGRVLVIGPVTDETGAIDKICERRGYVAVMPFSRMQVWTQTSSKIAPGTDADVAKSI